MAGLLILVAIGLLYIGYHLCVTLIEQFGHFIQNTGSFIGSVFGFFEARHQKRIIDRTLRAIAQTGKSQRITELMMWLREDLTPETKDLRYIDKLKEICADPNSALQVFKIALDSEEAVFEYIGIRGLVYLKKPEGFAYLLQYLNAPSKASYPRTAKKALLEFAQIAPITGENGFIRIFKMMVDTSTDSNLGDFMEKMLAIASQRSPDISDADFDNLLKWAVELSDSFIQSGDTRIRHIGEDFKKEVLELKKRRLRYQ